MPEKPKCATYIRRDSGFIPQTTSTYKDCILAITLLIGNKSMEFINVYAPSKSETMQFLANHTTNKDSYLAGEFNTHHMNWYGELDPHRSGVILASSRSAEFLVGWTDKHQYQLLNTPETCTHFPRNGSKSTIPDLTFARGTSSQITQSWFSDIGGGGDSDQAPLTTLMTIAPRHSNQRDECTRRTGSYSKSVSKQLLHYAWIPQMPR